MGHGDNPFADDDGAGDRTVIIPNPGGRRTAAPPPQADPPRRAPPPAAADDPLGVEPFEAEAPRAPPPRAAPAGPAVPIAEIGLNPLVVAANPLLGLAVRLRGRAEAPDIEALHDRVVAEVKAFEKRAFD